MQALIVSLCAGLFLCTQAVAAVNSQPKPLDCKPASERVAEIKGEMNERARAYGWQASILTESQSLVYIGEMRKMPRGNNVPAIPADHNTLVFWKSPLSQVVIIMTGKDGMLCKGPGYFMPMSNHIKVIKKMAGEAV